jgi:Protein of unknown function (DUF1003)
MCWPGTGLRIESSPWPTLTLIVSLEAIFLSTFVMIGQNRQAAFQQAKADHDFTEQELELKPRPNSPGKSTPSPPNCTTDSSTHPPTSDPDRPTRTPSGSSRMS